jgi:hypothetical protein
MNTQQGAVFGQPANADCIVKILGIFPVDGHGRPVAEVRARRPFLGRHFRGQALRFGQGFRGKGRGQPEPSDDDPRIDAWIIGKAEDLLNLRRIPAGGDNHARRGRKGRPGP